jgi:hypothetical protein
VDSSKNLTLLLPKFRRRSVSNCISSHSHMFIEDTPGYEELNFTEIKLSFFYYK